MAITPVQFVSKETTAGSHSSPVDVTIASTASGNDLVVMVENGEDPNSLPTVSSVTATGATFVYKGSIQNTSGTDKVNAETWVARNVSAGITSVSVAWTASAVGCVHVAEYSGVVALGQIIFATGAAAHPSMSLTTVDADNYVVAGFGNEDTGQGVYDTASAGTFRTAEYALGDGAPDVAGCLIDNTAASPGSVACTLSYGSAVMWAGVALELRTSAVRFVGRITQLHPQHATGRRYGSFAGKPSGSGSGHPVGLLTQLHPQMATGRRYGSFVGKAGGAPTPAGGPRIFRRASFSPRIFRKKNG